MKLFERGFVKDKAFTNIQISKPHKGDKPRNWASVPKNRKPSRCVSVSVDAYIKEQSNG